METVTSPSQMMMPITFFDIKGIVHFGFIVQGQTVNQAYYMETMKWLHEAVCRKSLNFGPMIGFSTMTILMLTRHSLSSSFLSKMFTGMEHPPYSPDLAPNDFCLKK
jgi:hypothetical protein